jgi:hypothetical protein
MTLNLIVSPEHIYQCSDFRLTYATGLQTDHEAQKIVPIAAFKGRNPPPEMHRSP